MNAIEELTRGLEHHRAGRFADAERIYRRVLGFEPNNHDALHLLGVARMQQGDPAGGVEQIRKAIAASPRQPVFHSSLAQALEAEGKGAEALAAYKTLADMVPHDAQTQIMAAHAGSRHGRSDLAVEYFQRAARAAPQNAAIHSDLCAAYITVGRYREAVECGQTAVMLDPQLAEAFANLGLAQAKIGDRMAGEASLRTAQIIKPDDAGVVGLLVHAMNDGSVGSASDRIALARQYVEMQKGSASSRAMLARALAEVGTREQVGDAVALYEALITERPDDVDLKLRLYQTHRKVAATTLGEGVARRMLAENPAYIRGHVLLGSALEAQGRLEEAEIAYRAATDAAPDDNEGWQGYLYVSLLTDRLTPQQQFQRHLDWAAASIAKSPVLPPRVVSRPEGGLLRVAYLSADFVAHPVGLFSGGVLGGHDKSRIHVTGLHNSVRSDDVTRWLRSLCNDFIETAHKSDEELAELIRDGAYDVVIDLGGHTGDNRQKALALLGAAGSGTRPVIATYLGYPATTANPAVAYRITDVWADPAGMTEALHTERLTRLDRTFLCFTPPDDPPAVVAPPSSTGKPFTFGSFNRISKMTPSAVKLFAAMMQGVPGSQLILKGEFADPAVEKRYREQFAAEGIAADRLIALAPDRDAGIHLARYGDVDVAIDTYPYHGTTTTCDALWMGVPVVSLVGKSHVSRVGLSIAHAIGLAELACDTVEGCVAAAAALAKDPARLAEVRLGMRARMKASPLMDAKGLATVLEAEYRKWVQAK